MQDTHVLGTRISSVAIIGIGIDGRHRLLASAMRMLPEIIIPTGQDLSAPQAARPCARARAWEEHALHAHRRACWRERTGASGNEPTCAAILAWVSTALCGATEHMKLALPRIR